MTDKSLSERLRDTADLLTGLSAIFASNGMESDTCDKVNGAAREVREAADTLEAWRPVIESACIDIADGIWHCQICDTTEGHQPDCPVPAALERLDD